MTCRSWRWARKPTVRDGLLYLSPADARRGTLSFPRRFVARQDAITNH
jgi:hypothetical protein